MTVKTPFTWSYLSMTSIFLQLQTLSSLPFLFHLYLCSLYRTLYWTVYFLTRSFYYNFQKINTSFISFYDFSLFFTVQLSVKSIYKEHRYVYDLIFVFSGLRIPRQSLHNVFGSLLYNSWVILTPSLLSLFSFLLTISTIYFSCSLFFIYFSYSLPSK